MIAGPAARNVRRISPTREPRKAVQRCDPHCLGELRRCRVAPYTDIGYRGQAVNRFRIPRPP